MEPGVVEEQPVVQAAAAQAVPPRAARLRGEVSLQAEAARLAPRHRDRAVRIQQEVPREHPEPQITRRIRDLRALDPRTQTAVQTVEPRA